MLNPYYGLFQYSTDNIYTLQINPDSSINPVSPRTHTRTHTHTGGVCRARLTQCPPCLCVPPRVSGPPLVFPLCGSCNGLGGVSQPLHQRQLHAAFLQAAAGQAHSAERPGEHRPRAAQEPRLDTVRTPPPSCFLTFRRPPQPKPESHFFIPAPSAERTTSRPCSITHSAWSTTPSGSSRSTSSNPTAGIFRSPRRTKKSM